MLLKSTEASSSREVTIAGSQEARAGMSAAALAEMTRFELESIHRLAAECPLCAVKAEYAPPQQLPSNAFAGAVYRPSSVVAV